MADYRMGFGFEDVTDDLGNQYTVFTIDGRPWGIVRDWQAGYPHAHHSGWFDFVLTLMEPPPKRAGTPKRKWSTHMGLRKP
ncbi:hypothetical protein [Mycolicibacterium septicum]|uniref:hypothetical protein n=1 Tax=Mycolicibacterium septicum TaxID=98668 RepID=UPI001AF77928|nr:hypothetical protein [Mycolicibacterium septicum]QRY51785.1 hypothetical protein JVX95_31165 [Mycolicibacterium septicum]